MELNLLEPINLSKEETEHLPEFSQWFIKTYNEILEEELAKV